VIATISGAINYYAPGQQSMLERGAITEAQIRAEETKRTNPERFAELRKQKYIQGVEVDRPAVISVNAFFAALAINEFLARIHAFRNVDNDEFVTVRGDLCEFALLREPGLDAISIECEGCGTSALQCGVFEFLLEGIFESAASASSAIPAQWVGSLKYRTAPTGRATTRCAFRHSRVAPSFVRIDASGKRYAHATIKGDRDDRRPFICPFAGDCNAGGSRAA
jgi:hypothetical protein